MKIKKIFTGFILAITIFSLVPFNNTSSAETIQSVTSDSALLIDYDTGKLLYEKNSDKQEFPASTTKMLTALIILEENKDLTVKTTMSPNPPRVGGSRLGFLEGEEVTLSDLLHALLINSANDAAVALAEFSSGSVDKFVEKMNQKAKELGCTGSNFVNPHGLHDPEHYSTAHDLAIIARTAFSDERLREIVKLSSYKLAPTNLTPEGRTAIATNRFLNGTGNSNLITYKGNNIEIKYDIVDGIKTGYTPQANTNLVSTAQKDGFRVIAVVLNGNGKDVYLDSRTLIDYGLSNYTSTVLTSRGGKVTTLDIPKGDVKQIDLLAKEEISAVVQSGTDLDAIEKEVAMSGYSLPLEPGTVLGEVTYKLDGEVLGKTTLYNDTAVVRSGVFSKITAKLLRTDENGDIDRNYYKKVGINLLISIIIWRFIVTWIKIKARQKARKKRLLEKKRKQREEKMKSIRDLAEEPRLIEALSFVHI